MEITCRHQVDSQPLSAAEWRVSPATKPRETLFSGVRAFGGEKVLHPPSRKLILSLLNGDASEKGLTRIAAFLVAIEIMRDSYWINTPRAANNKSDNRNLLQALR